MSRISPVAAIASRRRRRLLLGDALNVSASQSSFALSSYADLPADGSTTRGFTFTARNAAGTALAGKSATVATETITVSVANSYVTVSASSVAVNTDITVTLGLRDASNRPIPDIAVANLGLSSSGTGNTFGAWTGRTNQAGEVTRTFQSSVGEAKTITGTAFGQTITNTAAVTVGTPGSLFFESDWSTATGASSSAVRDGTKWDDTYIGSYAEVLEVVTAASVGANTGTLSGYTGNVLRTRQRGASYASKPRITNVPESTTHWLRWYFRNNETANRHLHPVSYAVGGSDGGIVIVPWARSGSTSGMELLLPFGGAYPYNEWHVGTSGSSTPLYLTNGTWYRYECEVRFLTGTAVRLYPRVYSVGGSLLYDSTNFYQTGYPWTTSLQDWYDAGNSATIASTPPTQIFSIGNEGPASSTDNDESWYFAKLAISLGTWVGA